MRLKSSLFAACAATLALCSPSFAGGNPNCCADLNGDGVVDAADLTILLAQWGTNGSANCSGDGIVDAADLTILLASWGPCPGGNPACPNPAHNCFTTGTPGCSDEACCNAVCTIDPFCCNNQWDTLCIGEAVDLCGNAACDTATNDCCTEALTPGCNDASCCNSVCLADPFCCATRWDGICAGEAETICGFNCDVAACGNSPNDCCVASANGTPFCSDADCCNAVCASDPFCCTNAWDGICAEEAGEICAPCGGFPVCGSSDHDCCTTGGPGCNDSGCCATVCAADPFCCNNQWDTVCVGEAEQLCGLNCGGEPACGNSANDCCAASPDGTPFCSDADCCNAVCAADPFCCENQWDGLCAGRAGDICAPCGGFPACGSSDHDCCTTGGPGCSDSSCCATVCAADPFCCNNSWDTVCVGEAEKLCGLNCGGEPACGNSANDCCAASFDGTPFCSDADCCNAVCAADPFCCSTQWDGLCAGRAGDICAPCGGFPVCGSSDHDCCTTGGPGCSDSSCCATVCAVDPFCCNNSWDTVCVGEAEDLCGLNCGGFAACPNPEHNCFTTGTPGCSDEACCNAVCTADPFCCNNSWDGACVNGANNLCGNDACPNPAHACNQTGTPGCSDETCCNEVCSLDAFCCATQWDGICVNSAAANCG